MSCCAGLCVRGATPAGGLRHQLWSHPSSFSTIFRLKIDLCTPPEERLCLSLENFSLFLFGKVETRQLHATRYTPPNINQDTRMCRLPLGGNHTTIMRSTWPLAICFALVATTRATAAATPNKHQRQQQQYQQARGPTDKLRRPRLLQPQHQGATTATKSDRGTRVRTSAWVSPHAERSAWVVRGGQHNNSDKEDGVDNNGAQTNSKREAEGEQPSNSYSRDSPPAPGASIASNTYQQGDDDSNATVEKIEKIAADFRAKTDDLAADVRARGEAMATDMKAKQERMTDELLRDRSPEAFGELGGHHSPYDSTTAGMDVANRRAFFLGIRRVVLLAQVVELVIACSWQAVFPYGGVAGFAARDKDSSATTPGGGGRGRLGFAVAAALGQAAVYTSLLAFFGCDRVVLRAVNVTGWEHGAAAAWVLTRTFGAAGKLPHLAACVWLTGMAFLCLYFGRQL